MSLRAALIWKDEFGGEIELASTIDDRVMNEVKYAALRLAELTIASNIGDEVREMLFRLEYEKLKETVEYVLPEGHVRRRR